MLDILIGAAAVCIIGDVVWRYRQFYEAILITAAFVMFTGIAATILLNGVTASSKIAAHHALAGSR